MNDQDIINIFITSKFKINPNKTRISWLNKHPEIKEYLENRYEEFKGYYYIIKCIYKKYKNLPRCKYCNEILNDPDDIYCSPACVGKGTVDKVKETCNKKYNVTSYSKTQECKIKSKRTKLERYDDENYINVDKAIQTWANKSIQEKKYYVDKSKATKLERYNDENYCNPEKIKNTLLLHYGVDNFAKTEMFHHNKKKKYYYNNCKFDSQYELCFYIYYKDKGYSISMESVKLKYEFNGKIHYYFPDFEIEGQLIEIKGEHFLDKETGKWINPYRNPKWTDEEYQEECDRYEAKRQCAIANNVKIIYNCSEYIKYVNQKYGKDFIKNCKK